MEQIKGVYAAGLSVLDKNLALDIKNTIKHAENVIDLGCHGVVFFWEHWTVPTDILK